MKVLIGGRHLGTRRAEVAARLLGVERRQLGLEGRPLLCARQKDGDIAKIGSFGGKKKRTRGTCPWYVLMVRTPPPARV